MQGPGPQTHTRLLCMSPAEVVQTALPLPLCNLHPPLVQLHPGNILVRTAQHAGSGIQHGGGGSQQGSSHRGGGAHDDTSRVELVLLGESFPDSLPCHPC